MGKIQHPSFPSFPSFPINRLGRLIVAALEALQRFMDSIDSLLITSSLMGLVRDEGVVGSHGLSAWKHG